MYQLIKYARYHVFHIQVRLDWGKKKNYNADNI